MKILNKTKNVFILLAVSMVIPLFSEAQAVRDMYFNVDWQLNSPVGNSYADKISGWGAHAELGYYVMPYLSVGGFVSFHTNNKYIDRQTLNISETSTVTTDQQHSIFQIPFGAVARYTFTRESLLEPYISAKLGASYSEVSSYMNIFKEYDRKWGFYISPELGTTLYFTPEKRLGIHAAIYYSYATNKSNVLGYSVDGLNNWGIRLGVAF